MALPPSDTNTGGDPRRPYRICRDLDLQLEVTLVCADSTSVVAEIVDLSARGTGLRWPAAAPPQLDLGEEVVLRFQPRPAGRPLELHATVRWRAVGAEGVRYGFEFGAFPTAAIDPRLWTLFNRRRTAR
ncbi:MAG: hypothetical protein COW73_07365 [Nitrospirae bacterium CG18_big_fil_WC_8_21_14_2_50_70_55]|nr:PilZ domain-containing protein [Deltaproteobacteria bacterium]OIP65577.1 MAG: hypothetical protein AUK30_04345 [Nitrospirae bacterium CG2_30_70_394]PIQ04787.1 MAG: hypothetical protein COW73_07365 [Nitrospirae bacterium CG18_big_fil_WC_8_21_14_2_50_70_55]PIU78227.1 MAG: hypothetical protein COS73_07955 [Nitrospirae bacterium CG06_land_8_20_14_3_00_70_43]PIW82232.1 MAG: hypothetical protein COZ96_09905 [Nitrospirae bacterium CG_4_8_14_3_um_filter_70_85]PIX83262.1 MAG: hypothetical protein CO